MIHIKPAIAKLFLIISLCYLLLQTALAANQLQHVNYSANIGGGELSLHFSQMLTSKPSSFYIEKNKQLIFDFQSIDHIPKSPQIYHNGVVKKLSFVASGQRLRVIIDVKNDVAYKTLVSQDKKNVIVKFSAQQPAVVEVDGIQYKGERISLNFQDISVRAVLQLLSEFTAMNMIVSDSVTGNISLRLKQVPWDQAFAYLLKSRGLAKRTMGNIMIVGLASEISAQEQAELKAKQALQALEPLQTETFTINYGDVKDYLALVNAPENSLLSSRGRAVMLESSNQIIIEDRPAKLKAIGELFRKADLPAKQVQIEARIVFVRKGIEQNIGVNWNIKHATDNKGMFDGFHMNLGAASSNALTTPALALGRLFGNYNIDLEISALEAVSEAELVASPRLLTSNNETATIEQGTQIPYQVTAPSGGSTIELVPAVLKLQVTPQITPNNKILLELEVTQDKPLVSESQGGQPPIDTRKVITNILVSNGETVVLGGVYEVDKQKVVTRVPFLSKIPLIGNLFRNTSTINNKSELMIFLTPKVIDTIND